MVKTFQHYYVMSVLAINGKLDKKAIDPNKICIFIIVLDELKVTAFHLIFG